ncbi:MAG: o-succinylbenzoate synthase [Streptosporangiaceae bacterium]
MPDRTRAGAHSRAFSIPLRSRFRGVSSRAGVLLQGPVGWGEFSPFPEYGPAECARWLAAAREAAYERWPAPVRDQVPVNVTVPAVDPERAADIVTASGCRTAKVKVAERGQSLRDDLMRVEAARDAIGTEGRIRVDVNGRWDVDEAVHAIGELHRFGLEYVEQPCATLDEMAALRRRIDVPIAADESIRKAADPLRVRAAEAADIVVLKVQPLGGVRPALAVAEACGLPAVVSSAVETSVGIAAGLALAAALPSLPYACGLATVQLLDGDVVAEPLLPADAVITLRRPQVDGQRLATYEIDGGDWARRMADAARVLDR